MRFTGLRFGGPYKVESAPTDIRVFTQGGRLKAHFDRSLRVNTFPRPIEGSTIGMIPIDMDYDLRGYICAAACVIGLTLALAMAARARFPAAMS